MKFQAVEGKHIKHGTLPTITEILFFLQRKESQEAIALARSNHEKFVTEFQEKLEELDQLKICFQGEKHQAEELRAMTEVLDPITS